MFAGPAHQSLAMAHSGISSPSHLKVERPGHISRIRRYSVQVIRMVRPLFGQTTDGDLEDWEQCRNLSRPGSLDALCLTTRFTRKEIQAIYNGFKQDCPNGTVSKERFKELYSQFFPLGDARTYSGHIYDSLDKNSDGNVTFDQFIVTMSVMSRGTIDEKIRWIFNLYDLNGDGSISPEEMHIIVSSIYDMLGKRTYPPADEEYIQEHADRIFRKMDLNGDGVITFQEFQEVCRNDREIAKAMDLFDTVL
ncbi:Kv channel-interacting protein 1-like isoform X2 [Paramacrobiotus metropolitanus]|uniref:Kv channel-interacting protein 1-like isoform X2 n=2 Tax=Paramacrobiotus metropolitanus TaxID=2943436 RepID=UPI002445DAF9|nr:Kv channel-interacting protein 1-like isoform X2 [Paramacrobiotus metropolitanus]